MPPPQFTGRAADQQAGVHRGRQLFDDVAGDPPEQLRVELGAQHCGGTHQLADAGGQPGDPTVDQG